MQTLRKKITLFLKPDGATLDSSSHPSADTQSSFYFQMADYLLRTVILFGFLTAIWCIMNCDDTVGLF